MAVIELRAMNVKWPVITGLLIITSDQDLEGELIESLARPDFKVAAAASPEEGWRDLSRGGFRLVLLDLSSRSAEGLGLIKKILTLQPPVKTVALVQENDLGLAVEALRSGAANFIPTPINPEILARLIDLALAAPD